MVKKLHLWSETASLALEWTIFTTLFAGSPIDRELLPEMLYRYKAIQFGDMKNFLDSRQEGGYNETFRSTALS